MQGHHWIPQTPFNFNTRI